jgi:alginate O-acetyltransferase complex protein AlgI
MLFCTGEYVLFLAAVVAVYWALPWDRGRVYLLLAASLFFYAKWSPTLALLVVGSSVVDYLIGRGLETRTSTGGRKVLLAASIGMNLGLLGYFKYANFFLDSLEDALRAAGATATLPTLRVILPIGLSFYTFEAISYAVDVYRRKIRAEKSLPDFLLFILFFPHLVAGPIVRARDFLPQVKRPKRWSWPRIGVGLGLLALGAFKKLAIADRMALFADPVFADTEAYSSAANWVAAVAFAVQVYCDFSGYSDMALGSAHLLGYKLVVNFRLPFLAPNVGEFWRRWHISLSNWLRDYLFFPLGGSRGGPWRTNRNLLLTMTAGGLWHGANWPFVAWGFLQGLLLVLHRQFAWLVGFVPGAKALLDSPAGTVGRVATTFLVFCLSVVVFRSPSLAAGGEMLSRMFVPVGGRPAPLQMPAFWLTIGVVVLGHVLGAWLGRGPFAWRRVFQATSAPILGTLGATIVVAAVVLGPGATKAFFYFQF